MTTAKDANVIWSPADSSEPPDSIQDGRERIDLPPPSVCRAGFFTADPYRLIRLSGGRFKLFVPKGDEAVSAGVPRVKIKKRGK